MARGSERDVFHVVLKVFDGVRSILLLGNLDRAPKSLVLARGLGRWTPVLFVRLALLFGHHAKTERTLKLARGAV